MFKTATGRLGPSLGAVSLNKLNAYWSMHVQIHDIVTAPIVIFVASGAGVFQENLLPSNNHNKQRQT